MSIRLLDITFNITENDVLAFVQSTGRKWSGERERQKKRKRTLSTASSNKIKNVNNAFFKTGP